MAQLNISVLKGIPHTRATAKRVKGILYVLRQRTRAQPLPLLACVCVRACVRVSICPYDTHKKKDHAIPCVCCAVPNLCIFWLVVWVQYCANLYPMYPDSLVQSFNTCLYNLTGRSQSPSCIFQQSVSHCMAIGCLNSTLSFAGSAQWQTMCMRSGQGGLLSLCLAVCRHCCCSSAASLQLMLCL